MGCTESNTYESKPKSANTNINFKTGPTSSLIVPPYLRGKWKNTKTYKKLEIDEKSLREKFIGAYFCDEFTLVKCNDDSSAFFCDNYYQTHWGMIPATVKMGRYIYVRRIGSQLYMWDYADPLYMNLHDFTNRKPDAIFKLQR